MNKDKIFYYIYDKRLVEISKSIPNIGNRAWLVQTLIASYNLLSKCVVCPSEEASDNNLLSFHSTDYIEFLKKVHKSSDLEKLTDSDEISNFNLGYDCPLFDKMYDFAKIIAGSSLTAAKKLISRNLKVKKTLLAKSPENFAPKSYLKMKNNVNKVQVSADYDISTNLMADDTEEFSFENEENYKRRDKMRRINKYETEFFFSSSNLQPIAINWFGGWHHAQRDEAGGFCYINDIVIAIQYLLKFFKRILYIDLDIHHGNGVENAFYFSSKVLTFSLHKFEPGFYPATGTIDDIGEGNGKFYAINVPLKEGITDDKYINLFEPIFKKIIKNYLPQCVVIQCGADCMPGDPLGGFNLTPEGLGNCLKIIISEKLPTLILGGGGYNIINTSKCWTYLTSVILNEPISNDIPDHSFLHVYGPEFELKVTKSLRKDENSDEYLNGIRQKILDNLDSLTVAKD